jgi:hypothetical protein
VVLPRFALEQAYRGGMWTVLVILLVAWAILTIVGFALEGLLWLGVIGIVLFVGTIIFGILRNRAGRAKRQA